VFDLLDLANDLLPVRYEPASKSFSVKGLLQVECVSFDDLVTVLVEGGKNRRIGCTALNKDSSRSHRCARRWRFAVAARVGSGLPAPHAADADSCCCAVERKTGMRRDQDVLCLSNSLLSVSVARTSRADGFSFTKRGKLVFVDLAGA
jgi:hypothetical protein